MGHQKHKSGPGDEGISALMQLIHKKNDETKALKKLLKALENDGIKTNIKPNSKSNEKTNDQL